MLKSYLDLLAKHHTHSYRDILSAVVFISFQPNNKCQTLDMSCRVQLLSLYKHMRKKFLAT